MAGINLKEWIQEEWLRPRVRLFDRPGDFDNLWGMYPDGTGRCLRRSPGWSAHIGWPADFDRCEDTFYDRYLDIYLFVGRKISTHTLAIASYNNEWGFQLLMNQGVTVGSPVLSGAHGRCIAHLGEDLYYLSGSNLYRAHPWAEPATLLMEDPPYIYLLAHYGGYLYAADSSGIIYRIADDLSAMNVEYTPPTRMYCAFMGAFNQYILLVAKGDDGHLQLFRLADLDPAMLHQLDTAPSSTATTPSVDSWTWGNPFTLCDDKLYFLSGFSRDGRGTRCSLMAFNGSGIDVVTEIRDLPALENMESAGLLAWHDRVVFYILRNDTTTHIVRLLVGSGTSREPRADFIDFMPTTAVAGAARTALYSLANNLVLTAEDGFGNEGFHRPSGFQNQCYYQSSWLHFGQPGRRKNLHALIALISDDVPDFDVSIYYRTDYAANWTLATAADDTRRVAAENLATEFYLLQIRVLFDDNTSENQDVTLDSISALYSIKG
jgi:hypothetical protein